jgi:hypothetical protein
VLIRNIASTTEKSPVPQVGLTRLSADDEHRNCCG